MERAQVHLLDLWAVYVPATQNSLANYLSRETLSNNEWSLNQQVFSILTKTCGIPEVDLAATPKNSKCQRFLSRAHFPSAEGTNCLALPWSFELGYIFLPTSRITRFLSRLRRSSATVIVLIPFRPRRPWFTTLLQLGTRPPIHLPVTWDLIHQRQFFHPAQRSCICQLGS